MHDWPRFPTLILAALAALTLAACGGGNSPPPTVAGEDDVVSVHYVGTLDDGSPFDSSRTRGQPLTFTLGTGEVIVGFDEAVLGMAVGETITVRIPPERAYDERDEALVLEMPRSNAPSGVVAGDVLQLLNGQPATVVELRGDTIVIDANHQLAGQALTFEIELVEVEEG